MPIIKDRYASAVRSSNLRSAAKTRMSDSDVLGAYGIADRRLSSGQDHFTKHPLAVPLERLFLGDDRAAGEVIRILAELIRKKAPSMRVHITKVQAEDMARAALGWFRKPTCRVCGGHGFKLINGTKTLGDSKCTPCKGSGQVQFEQLFRLEQRDLVRWIMARMDLEAGMAAPAAMKAIASQMEF
jgi:hypothetical protein